MRKILGNLVMVNKQDGTGVNWFLVENPDRENSLSYLIEDGDTLSIWNLAGALVFCGIISPDFESVRKRGEELLEKYGKADSGIQTTTWTQRGFEVEAWAMFFDTIKYVAILTKGKKEER